MDFPGGSVGKEHTYQCRKHRRLSWIPGSGRAPGGGHGNPLQYSCLENPMDGGAGRAIVYGVEKSRTRLKWLSSSSKPFSWTSQVVVVVKNLPANAGELRDMGSIPELGRSPGGGHGNPLQYSCLENPKDRGAWRATVHRVAKNQTQLKPLSTMHTHAVTVWIDKIPWKGKVMMKILWFYLCTFLNIITVNNIIIG